MSSNPENVRRIPLSAERARFRELVAKQIDWFLDYSVMRFGGGSEDLIKEVRRRITELEEQMKDRIPFIDKTPFFC